MKKEGNVAQFTSPCIFQKNVRTQHHFYLQKKTIKIIGGSRSASPGQKFHHFHAVLRKNWPNNRLAGPLLGWCPRLGNAGSTTENQDFWHNQLSENFVTNIVISGSIDKSTYIFSMSNLSTFKQLLTDIADKTRHLTFYCKF